MPLRYPRIIGFILLLLLTALAIGVVRSMNRLGATSVSLLLERESENAILVPCTRFTDEDNMHLLFRDGNFEQWPDEYHRTAAAIIEEHAQSFSRAPSCAAETSDTVLPAGPKLRELAEKLPTWKNNAEELGQWEMSSVLLEYLRSYECALQERLYFLHPDAQTELQFLLGNPEEGISLDKLVSEVSKEDRIIARELPTARLTLNRALAVLAGLSRLLPLHTELQCIERASLDIRNAIALGAETSACLPRIWNAKDPLRDLTP